MSFRDWLDCPECEDGGDPTFDEFIDAQKRVIKCNECGYDEFIKLSA